MEAARAAKERWGIRRGRPVELRLSDSLALGSEVKAEMTISRETVETLRSEGIRIMWTEPVNAEDPTWMGQAFDDDGTLLEMALGDNPEDVLLALAKAFLPKGWKPDGG